MLLKQSSIESHSRAGAHVAVSHRLQSRRGDSREGVLEVRLEASSPAGRVSGWSSGGLSMGLGGLEKVTDVGVGSGR